MSECNGKRKDKQENRDALDRQQSLYDIGIGTNASIWFTMREKSSIPFRIGRYIAYPLSLPNELTVTKS